MKTRRTRVEIRQEIGSKSCEVPAGLGRFCSRVKRPRNSSAGNVVRLEPQERIKRRVPLLGRGEQTYFNLVSHPFEIGHSSLLILEIVPQVRKNVCLYVCVCVTREELFGVHRFIRGPPKIDAITPGGLLGEHATERSVQYESCTPTRRRVSS